MTEKQSNDEKIRSLKLQVLEEHRDFLCRELGDPARYLPYLRSKGVLDDSSAERIKSKATTSDKVAELVESLTHCGGENYNGHPLDVLIEGIKRQKVQLHISRVLLKAANKLIRDTAPQGENSQQDAPVSGNTPPPVAPLTGNRPQRPDYSRSVEDDTAGSHEYRTAEHNGYESHPEYGPLPPHLPPYLPPPAPKMDDIHPEYGPLPSPPPTTLHRSDGSSHSISNLEQQQQTIYPPLLFYPSSSPTTSDDPALVSAMGHGGSQEIPPFTPYAHSDDSEYYRTQLEQKDVDIRSLQSQLRATRDENEKLKARIDTLEKDLTLARQGRGGGTTNTLGAPRPVHLPFSRSPDHNPSQHTRSLGTPPQAMAHSSSFPLVKGSSEHPMRHDKRSSTPGHRAHNPSHHGSLVTPLNSSNRLTTPITFDSSTASTPSTTIALTSSGNDHSTDV